MPMDVAGLGGSKHGVMHESDSAGIVCPCCGGNSMNKMHRCGWMSASALRILPGSTSPFFFVVIGTCHLDSTGYDS